MRKDSITAGLEGLRTGGLVNRTGGWKILELEKDRIGALEDPRAVVLEEC
jgi:hypothetical protein